MPHCDQTDLRCSAPEFCLCMCVSCREELPIPPTTDANGQEVRVVAQIVPTVEEEA